MFQKFYCALCVPAHHSHCLAHSNLYIRSCDCLLLGLIAWALHISTVLLQFHALGAVAALPPVVPCRITEGTHVAPPSPEIPPPCKSPPPPWGGTVIWPKKLRKSQAPKVQKQIFLLVNVELGGGGGDHVINPPRWGGGGGASPAKVEKVSCASHTFPGSAVHCIHPLCTLPTQQDSRFLFRVSSNVFSKNYSAHAEN